MSGTLEKAETLQSAGKVETAGQLASAVLAGRKTAVEAVTEALGRLEKYSSLNAMVHIDPDVAMAAAQRVDSEIARGRRNLPLAGVPFVIKDSIMTSTMPTTAGSSLLRNFKPARTATVVELMIEAGAIPIGKANLHELAFGITGVNPKYGTVKNPHDMNRIAGGSSSGTAAAVATAVPLGLATDTGGSARIPAAFCGIYGFRPSLNRYPKDGRIEISRTLDTIGTMARSIYDLCLMDDVLTQKIVRTTWRLPHSRIAVPSAAHLESADEHVRMAMIGVLDGLRDSGVTFEEIDISRLSELDQSARSVIALHEARAWWSAFCQDKLGMSIAELASEVASADVRNVFEFMCSHEMFSDRDYFVAMNQREEIISWYEDLFRRKRFDCLMRPTTLCVPPLASDVPHNMPTEASAALFSNIISQTSPASIAGIPSLSMPATFPDANLPVGVMCEGPFASDSSLLSLAADIDQMIRNKGGFGA
ncbi:amidase family protein [Duganella sp. Dugasp56]|uniref:amidase family protein n=1 Tax=Duganella sp. Dugasp56 TaxID=3243046 RepID=UPI0039AEADBB